MKEETPHCRNKSNI